MAEDLKKELSMDGWTKSFANWEPRLKSSRAEKRERKKRRKRKRERLPGMDRIVIKEIVIGKEVVVEGPPLEALRFQGGRAGSLVTLTDRTGRDWRGRVLQLSHEKAVVFPFEAFPASTESPLEIILLQALPEKERMEWIIQKTTELGVSVIVPFKSGKSISLEEREAKQRKAHRWQEIAINAVRQSRRAKVPLIQAYRSFQESLEFCRGAELKLILWEKEGKGLKEILKPSETICVMVGPEGGLTSEEVASAEKFEFIPIKLGQRILRTETAAIALVGIIQYELGDLG
jgi:16S rRNA (uracil1498-N3)-methyltransferase